VKKRKRIIRPRKETMEENQARPVPRVKTSGLLDLLTPQADGNILVRVYGHGNRAKEKKRSPHSLLEPIGVSEKRNGKRQG